MATEPTIISRWIQEDPYRLRIQLITHLSNVGPDQACPVPVRADAQDPRILTFRKLRWTGTSSRDDEHGRFTETTFHGDDEDVTLHAYQILGFDVKPWYLGCTLLLCGGTSVDVWHDSAAVTGPWGRAMQLASLPLSRMSKPS